MKFAFYAERYFFPKISRVIVLLGRELRKGGVYLSLIWRPLPSEGNFWSPAGRDQKPFRMPSPGHWRQKVGFILMRQLIPGPPQVKLWQPTRLWKTVNKFQSSSEDFGNSLGSESASPSQQRRRCPKELPWEMTFGSHFYFQNEKWGTEGLVKNHKGRSEQQYLTSPRDRPSAESKLNQQVCGGPSSQWLCVHCLPS